MLEPVIGAVEFLARVLFDVAKVIFTVVGAIATALVAVWNAILDAIAGIVDAVVALFTAGAVRSAGDFVRKGKASTQMFDDAVNAMSSTSYDAAAAAAQKAKADQEAAGAAQDAAQAVGDFAESFLNVPSGYKVSSARFAATGESGRGYGGALGSEGGTTIIIGSVDVGASNPIDFVKSLEAMGRAETFRTTGSNYGPPQNRR